MLFSSSREAYGDDAIGWVQLKRGKGCCTVKGRIVPEHKVRDKAYHVEVVFDEKNSKIKKAQCQDCSASSGRHEILKKLLVLLQSFKIIFFKGNIDYCIIQQNIHRMNFFIILGGCKHLLAFVFWIHRRSEQPAPTSIECYWKKPKMAGIGTTVKFIEANKLGKRKRDDSTSSSSSSLLNNLKNRPEIKKIKSQLTIHIFPGECENSVYDLSLHRFGFKLPNVPVKPDEFLEKMSAVMTPELCCEAELTTRNQSKDKFWFEIRYGRITASKIFDVSQCRTADGSLVKTILGSVKVRDTEAMKRGKRLEDQILKVVEKKLKTTIGKSGVFLDKKYPFLEASPDGINAEYVFEIKSPSKKETVKNYVEKKVIKNKYLCQIYLQMLLAHKKKGYFCVADPDFEKTEKVDIVPVVLNEKFILDKVKKSEKFWKECIFPKLFK